MRSIYKNLASTNLSTMRERCYFSYCHSNASEYGVLLMALVDIMHGCQMENKDFEVLLSNARKQFAFESAYENEKH
jgi:hypothetical protein